MVTAGWEGEGSIGCSLVEAMLTGGQRSSRVWKGSFPGGSVVKNLPARAGDIGLTPGLGGSHMLCRGKPQLLNLCPRTQKQQLLSPSA